MVTVAKGRAPIPSVPAQPPRYGLLVAAGVSPMNGVRWQEGVSWNPEECGNSGKVRVYCSGSTDPMGENGELNHNEIVTADPFAVWASDECSPFGFQARDWSGRATRQLEATQSFQIADELWNGTLQLEALADGDSDLQTGGYLRDVSTITDTYENAGTPVHALGCTEQALGECGQGRRGMIHVTPAALDALVAAQAVRIEGTQYLTPLGNVVVADAAYTGDGPGAEVAGSTQWMYATGIIAVTLEQQAKLEPGSLDNAQNLAVALNRSDNTITVRAMKLALYQWDRCCHIATEFDLAVCTASP